MLRGVEARRVAYQLACKQLGALRRDQVLKRGVSRRTFEYWTDSGYLLKVLPAVYTLGRPATNQDILWMASCLFAGSGSALTGSAGLAALGAGGSSEQIEIVRPAGKARRVHVRSPHLPAVVTTRSVSLEPEDFSFCGPIPVLEPARLLIDSAGRVSSSTLRRQFIELGRNDLLDSACLSRIETRSERFQGRRRLVFLASCWDPTKGRIRSVLEGEFKLMCAERQLPAPLTNHRIGKYEVDALWRRERLVVELDGRRFHGDAFALEADSQKTRDLRSLGYRVLRFTWLDVTERPEWVASRIREALGAN